MTNWKNYLVSGFTKKGGRIKEYAIIVAASNAKEAKATALELWDNSAHLFRLGAKRTNESSLHKTHWYMTGEETPSHNWVEYV